MTVLIRIFQLILSLSILVIIHELGHFLFARLNGVRVSKFYMFFNPQFSLVRWKKINGKWQFKFFAPNTGDPINNEEELAKLDDNDWRKYPEQTEWGIGWLPLGGYCAIAGMVDETTNADQLGTEPQPWEYRSKKTWQRLPIICGGVLVNLVGAFLIYSAILFHWGSSYIPLSGAQWGLQYAETFIEDGLKQGDLIIKVGDRTPEQLADLRDWIFFDGEHQIVALRKNQRGGNDTVRVRLSDTFERRFMAAGAKSFIEFRFPLVVAEVLENSAAMKAGIEQGDSIVAVCGVPTPCFQDVTAELEKHACDSVTINVVRAGELLTLCAYVGDEGKIGLAPKHYATFIEPVETEYNILECIPAGIKYGWETLVNYVKQLRLIFTPEGAKSLGGFGAIGSMFPETWNWFLFWHTTAFLSVILAFMNIIPIPGLDGGHVMFLLWEMITRKKPSDKFLEIANNVGFYLLLALLIYANGNDIFRWLMKFFQ